MKSWAFVVLISLAAAACGGASDVVSPTAPSATAPSATAPPPSPRVSSSATPIGLGETVQRVINISDPPYDTRWGPEPSLRFAVTVRTSGILRAHVTSPGPGGLTLWVNEKAFWGANNEIAGTVEVQAGTTYEVVVSMHDPQGASQSFALTTSLERQ